MTGRLRPWRAASAAALVAALAVAAMLAPRGAPPAAAEGGAAEIPWRRDVDAAFAEAREKGAPLLVVFRCET